MNFSFTLSPQSIDALAMVISGGSPNDPAPPIGHYRSGPKLEQFMRSCGVSLSIGDASRFPSLVECLKATQRSDNNSDRLCEVIEKAADPRDFLDSPEKLVAVVEYLNKRLRFDKVELQLLGTVYKLCVLGQHSWVVSSLSVKAEIFDMDTVRRDLDRALANAESDPEDAVTSACSAVESMCRSIIIELGNTLPDKKDITGLYKAVREPLGLTPNKAGIPSAIANDVLKVLSGLATCVEGIGSLRTHGGDAHGRERGYRRIDARIARLAINSASTTALFLLETWQHKYPNRELKRQ